MDKIFITFFLTSFSIINIFAQDRTEDFIISLPEQKVQGSLYKTISFIDSRYDTSSMGIVQLGAFNRKAKVVPKIHLSAQLISVLNSLTDSSAQNGELLFQLRQFNFAEITGAFSEKGYCYMRAALYSKAGSYFKKVNYIDTVIIIKAMDVTRALFRNGSKVITNFISSSLQNNADSMVLYSYADLINIDSIEKRKIPAYNTTAFTDGLYISFQSFMNQTPDKKAFAEMKKEKLIGVKATDTTGELIKVKSKDIYAIVYQGKPFIATDYGYYPLNKINDEFNFTGKAKITANSMDVAAASFFFGIIGGLIASNVNATFEMKIDHINGGFIRLREINDTIPEPQNNIPQYPRPDQSTPGPNPFNH